MGLNISAFTDYAGPQQAAFNSLNGGLAALGKGFEEARRRGTREDLAAGISDPNADYRALASKALAAGETDMAASLLKMSEQQLGARADAAAAGTLSGMFGGDADTPMGKLGAGMGRGLGGVETGTPRAPSFASSSGPSGDYLSTLVGRESGGDPNAKNPASSATGLGQFTRPTWDRLVATRPDLGLTADGRTDPQQSIRATKALADENGQLLAGAEFPVNDKNLYLGHLLGGKGAVRFLGGMSADPNAPAIRYVTPEAAAANRTIFYDRNGAPRSAADVYQGLTSKFGSGRTAEANPADLPMQGSREAGYDPMGNFSPGIEQTPDGYAIPPAPSRGGVPADPSSPFAPGRMGEGTEDVAAPGSAAAFTGSTAIRGEPLPAIEAMAPPSSTSGRSRMPIAAAPFVERAPPLPPARPAGLGGVPDLQALAAPDARAATPQGGDWSNTRDAGALDFITGGAAQAAPGLAGAYPSGAPALRPLPEEPAPAAAAAAPPFARPLADRSSAPMPTPSIANPSASQAPVARQPVMTMPSDVEGAPAAPARGVAVPGYPGAWTPESAAAAREAGQDAPSPGAVERLGQKAASDGAPATGSPFSRWQTPSEVPASVQTSLGRTAIPKLVKILADPRVGPGMREVTKTFLATALNESKAPESLKEFMWAKGNGMTTAANPAAYAREMAEAKDTKNDPGETIRSQGAARSAEAARLGLDPASPEGRRYVLEGKLGTDEKPDKKAIQEADTAITAAQDVISTMAEAKSLSAKAYDGFQASRRGEIAANFGNERGVATMRLNNTVISGALTQLKSIFGGNPTEGERKILLDIEGSADKPREVRDAIFDRASKAAERRLGIAMDKANELRGGTYYKPGGGRSADASAAPQARASAANAAPAGNIPSGAVEMLRGDPSLASAFDAKYGAGASRSVLGR